MGGIGWFMIVELSRSPRGLGMAAFDIRGVLRIGLRVFVISLTHMTMVRTER